MQAEYAVILKPFLSTVETDQSKQNLIIYFLI